MLLILTATLGESRFLESAAAAVAALKLEKRHLLIVPAEKVAWIRKRFDGCEVVPDAGVAGGLYGALNAGLRAAGGDWDWFTCVNDDDLPGRDFELLARAHAEAGDQRRVTYGNVALMGECGRPQGLISVEKTPRRFPGLLQAGVNPLSHPGMIFGRRVLEDCGEFDARRRVCGDLDFWLKAYKAGYSFAHYAGEAARFRLRRGQLSSSPHARAEMRAIVGQYFPERPTAAEIIFNVLRFRLSNAPRRLRRLWSTGWLNTAASLAHGRAEPSVGSMGADAMREQRRERAHVA